MAVFTQVSLAEAQALFDELKLGTLRDLRGIAGGIENTNYFATSDQGEFVLTLFERLSFEQLPFYLELMAHLAQRGIPAPGPARSSSGQLVLPLKGKPAAVVNKLAGASELLPQPSHCAAIGAMLARMHLAARDFEPRQPNLRALPWWNSTAPLVLPHLDASQAQLLRAELAYQNHVAASAACAALPRGPVHADLFRDNVLFDQGTISGVFDFYFAGYDSWLFDLCVCLNDWCIDLDSGHSDLERGRALLQAYCAVRPLCRAERELFSAMRRAAALRFWISRLWDFYLPREAQLLKAHDPSHFERVLRHNVLSSDVYRQGLAAVAGSQKLSQKPPQKLPQNSAPKFGPMACAINPSHVNAKTPPSHVSPGASASGLGAYL